MREALAAVRRDLGPGALVLSTQLVSASGLRGLLGAREVEITAAIDRPMSNDRPPRPVERPGPGAADGLTARLLAAGLDPRLVQAIVAQIPAEERRHVSDGRLRALVAQSLAGLAADQDATARIEVFVGPPGVGKTTTIAKLAARVRAGNGQRLGMIAADGFRAGAVEQLRAYADIIGSPFHVARTPAELDHVLAQGRGPLLVDTAGRSPRDAGTGDVIEVLGRRRGVRTHLVLAADTSIASARRIFDAYDIARPDRVVLTKLDETESVMPLLTLLGERRLPVSFVAAGQRVPEDLARATPAVLASAALGDASSLQETYS